MNLTDPDIKYQDNKEKTNYFYKIIQVFFCILLCLFVFSYFVTSIAFLISDYRIFSYGDKCYLWTYVCSYVCLIMLKLFLLKYECCIMKINFCNCLFFIIIELIFTFNGFNIILFDNTCKKFSDTNLWIIGIFSFVIQSFFSVIYGFLIIIFISNEICKIKTPCCCVN